MENLYIKKLKEKFEECRQEYQDALKEAKDCENKMNIIQELIDEAEEEVEANV